ncbi:MAG: hypothetical protein QM760_17525, partial [Nibricoccus sp.]
PFTDAVVASEGNVLTLSGQGSEWNGKPGAIRFKGLLRVLNDGWLRQIADGKITVTAANSVTLPAVTLVNYQDLSANRAACSTRDLTAA